MWQRAEKLTIVLELRGFRKYDTRENYREISLARVDYVIIVATLSLTLLFIYTCHVFKGPMAFHT
jgi:energy-coupling factor transporter transmembrane protein EcfT